MKLWHLGDGTLPTTACNSTHGGALDVWGGAAADSPLTDKASTVRSGGAERYDVCMWMMRVRPVDQAGGISTPACDPLRFHYRWTTLWAHWGCRRVLMFQNNPVCVCVSVHMRLWEWYRAKFWSSLEPDWILCLMYTALKLLEKLLASSSVSLPKSFGIPPANPSHIDASTLKHTHRYFPLMRNDASELHLTAPHFCVPWRDLGGMPDLVDAQQQHSSLKVTPSTASAFPPVHVLEGFLFRQHKEGFPGTHVITKDIVLPQAVLRNFTNGSTWKPQRCHLLWMNLLAAWETDILVFILEANLIFCFCTWAQC